MIQTEEKRIKEVASNFQFEGELIRMEPYGHGHINDTYLLTYSVGKMGCIRIILQRMNKNVFPKPVELMENIVNVTSFLHDKIIENGGDPYRETLNVIPAKDGRYYYKETENDYWRAFIFVTDAASYDVVEQPEDFYESGRAFGKFQYLLADFPVEKLHETIANFHNTKSRLADFKKAVADDIAGRAAGVQAEIQFVLDREKDACFFTDLIEKGELPIRVTHNDTKLNNIMIDNKTRKGICVIDLDTTMPGLALYDYGDSIRFGANTGEEDERDLSKVGLDMHLFEVYTKGFIEGCGGRLTDREIELLPMGAKIMTFECGMRFLTDYLQNDVYFKTSREGHNLDRARSQFKLVADMENKWAAMNAVISSVSQKACQIPSAPKA
jgi:Ser/Thr protein kinase RdoA (MazF antagonist)